MTSFTLRLSGPMQVEKDGERLEGFESDKALALLAYLALHGDPVSRRHLAGLFWEAYPPKRARGNLRRVLHNLRSLLPDCLAIDRERVQFKPGDNCHVDVLTFRALAVGLASGGPGLPTVAQDPQHLEAALSWFRGPLLEGLALDDCPTFELWLVPERERWQQCVVGVLEQLIDHDTQRGDYTCALGHVDHLLRLTPWREAAHRQRMWLLAHIGQRSAALRQYAICCRILQQELGVAPLPGTTALYERLRAAGDSARYRLPASPQPVAFVGREAELAAIGQRLADPACRLLTLVGMGGVGKTRLAHQAAQVYEMTFLDGVVFVSLAGVASAADLPAALVAALQLPVGRQTDPQTQLMDYVRDKELLLVLDNFEHLLDGTPLLARLLDEAPDVTLLVTSRARLNLRTPWVLEVLGLEVPPDAGLGAEDAGFDPKAYSALRLFMQVARRYRKTAMPATPLPSRPQEGGRALKGDHAMVRICRLLDGLPLGIELAAAWGAERPFAEVAETLQANLNTLHSRFRDMPVRHRSLHAICEYSWAQLTETERDSFAKLSVFHGGCDRQAAVHVSGASMTILARLVEKSMVRYDDDTQRYTLHESLRQYAATQLALLPSVEAATHARHGVYYLQQLARCGRDFKTDRQDAAQRYVARELENCRAAWAWALAHQQWTHLRQAARGMGEFYYYQYVEAGAALFGGAVAALVTVTTPEGMHTRALMLAWYSAFVPAEDAPALLQEALSIVDALDSSATLGMTEVNTRATLALILRQMGRSLHLTDRPRAMDCHRRSLALYRQLDDRYSAASELQNLAHVTRLDGRHAEARQYLEESIRLFRPLGARWALATSLEILSYVDLYEVRLAESEHHIRECTALRLQGAGAWRIAGVRYGLGFMLVFLGHYPEAVQELEAARAAYRLLNSRARAADTRLMLGIAQMHLGQYPAARANVAAAHACYQAVKDDYAYARACGILGAIDLATGAMAQALAELQESLTLYREAFQPNTYRCYALSDLALAHLVQNAPQRAFVLLQEVLQTARDLHTPILYLYALPALSVFLAGQGDATLAGEATALAQQFRAVRDSSWFTTLIAKARALTMPAAIALPTDMLAAVRAVVADLRARLKE